MLSIKSSLLAVVILPALALGFPASAIFNRQTGTSCQSSSGSPSTGDLTDAINELKGKGDIMCYQENGAASMCTTVVTQGSAAIAVCGGVDDDSSVISCMQVAQYAVDIQDYCKIDDNGVTRVGGTYTVSASKRVIVDHA